MSISDFQKDHLFTLALILSAIIHGYLIFAVKTAPSDPNASVFNAPNSLEIHVIRQPVVTVIEQEIETEEIIPDHQTEPVVVRKSDDDVKPRNNRLSAVNSRKSQGAITKAKPLINSNLAPLYPPLARKRGWEGIVRLSVLVRNDGTADQVDIQESSGYQILDRAAQNAVKNWKFTPAKSGPMRISSKITLPIQFTLISE